MSKALKPMTRAEVAQHTAAGDLWIIIDSVVYDLSKFGKLHPGGLGVLLDADVAGQDATTVFYGLHRQEVLLKPQYQRLRIGQIEGEQPKIRLRGPSDLSRVPYAEPAWLTPDFVSPYFNDSHRTLQKSESTHIRARERAHRATARELAAAVQAAGGLAQTAARVG